MKIQDWDGLIQMETYGHKISTLTRKFEITEGVTENPTVFDPTIEWDSLPNNTFTNLGNHECECNVNNVYGCNDISACNYNSEANINDNSCLYPPTGYDCNYNYSNECAIDYNQEIMFSDPNGSYQIQLINEEISLEPFNPLHDTLTAFPNASIGYQYSVN